MAAAIASSNAHLIVPCSSRATRALSVLPRGGGAATNSPIAAATAVAAFRVTTGAPWMCSSARAAPLRPKRLERRAGPRCNAAKSGGGAAAAAAALLPATTDAGLKYMITRFSAEVLAPVLITALAFRIFERVVVALERSHAAALDSCEFAEASLPAGQSGDLDACAPEVSLLAAAPRAMLRPAMWAGVCVLFLCRCCASHHHKQQARSPLTRPQ
jgi:hypothetical protein